MTPERVGHIGGWLLVAALAAFAVSRADAQAPELNPPEFELYAWNVAGATAATGWQYQRGSGLPWHPVPAYVQSDARVWGLVPKDAARAILRVRGVSSTEIGAPSPWSFAPCEFDYDGDRFVGVPDWLALKARLDAFLEVFPAQCR